MSNAKVLLVHGIRFKDKTVFDKLLEELKRLGVDAELVDYGYVLLPITNKKAVRTLQDAVKPYWNRRLMVLGYSNGAWTAVQGAETGLNIRQLFLVNAALNVRHEIPGQVEKADVYFSSGDVATRFARFRRQVSRILPWRWNRPHGWGSMGTVGYKGDDARVTNHEMPRDVRHTFYEDGDQVKRIAEHIAQDALDLKTA